jgi:hypothetical protein
MIKRKLFVTLECFENLQHFGLNCPLPLDGVREGEPLPFEQKKFG